MREDKSFHTIIIKKKIKEFTYLAAIGYAGGGVYEEFFGKLKYNKVSTNKSIPSTGIIGLWTDSLGLEECKRRGLSGRKYVMTKEIGMTSKMMGENFIDSVETLWNHWKPRKRFTIVDTKELNIKYPAGTILE